MQHDISQKHLRVGRSVEIVWVRLGDLRLDRRYQRAISASWIRRLVSELREEYMPPLHASLRRDGGYYVVDGQHRVATLVERHGEDAAVQVIVYRGLSFNEERMLFFILNKVLQVSRRHVHEVGASLDLGIDGMIRELGEKYDLTGRISSVATLQEIAREGGEYGLERVMNVVGFAWREHVRRINRDMLRGLWLALKSDETADEEIAMGLLLHSPADLELIAIRHRSRLECSKAMACMLAIEEVAQTP